MRFATFAAFMLPLAALAEPISFSSLSKIATPLNATSDHVESVIKQLLGHTENSPLRALETAQLASTTVLFGNGALKRMLFPDVGPAAPSDREYVDSLCAYTIVKNELTRRFCS